MHKGLLLASATLVAQFALMSPVLAKPTPAKTAKLENPDKVVCKRFPVLGSLIEEKKVCHTKAEWRKLADEAQEDTESVRTTKSLRQNN